MLESGKLGGAVIDVWENEPDIDRRLLAATFLSTPHIAGYSTDGKANGTSMIVNALCKYYNLPLKKWYPEDIPDPDEPVLSISETEKTNEDVLREAVSKTYNIDEDNINLRFSPSDFDNLRNDYKIRREFNAYTVKLNGGTRQSREMLQNLGFNVV